MIYLKWENGIQHLYGVFDATGQVGSHMKVSQYLVGVACRCRCDDYRLFVFSNLY